MAIIMRLDRIMADRKMTSVELSKKIGISPVNVSRIKTGRAHGIRFDTLDSICKALDCQPNDVIEYVDDNAYEQKFGDGDTSDA